MPSVLDRIAGELEELKGANVDGRLESFRAGDLEAPVKITDRTSRESMKAFARELQKIRLVQG